MNVMHTNIDCLMYLNFHFQIQNHVKTDWIEYIMCHFQLPNKLKLSLDLGDEAKLMVSSQVSPIWPSIGWISLSSH